MDKKGAIEFSMTTIMVIIIGVAVLALGLAWIRGTFTQVSTITEEALANAETILGEVGFTGRISAPATIILDAGGDAKKFRVYVRNTDPATVTMPRYVELITPTLPPGTDSCFKIAGLTSGRVKLNAGEQTELGGGILSTCAAGKSTVIEILINSYVAPTGGSAEGYASEAIAVQVR